MAGENQNRNLPEFIPVEQENKQFVNLSKFIVDVRGATYPEARIKIMAHIDIIQPGEGLRIMIDDADVMEELVSWAERIGLHIEVPAEPNVFYVIKV